MPARRLVLSSCVVLAAASVVVAWALELEFSSSSRPSLKPVQQSSKRSRPLVVTLDPAGRPYDKPIRPGGTVTRRRLAVLHAPSRQVLFMGGENTLYVRAGDFTPMTLAERPGRRYPVDAIWLREHYPSGVSNGIVGVAIVERDTPVVRWVEEGPGYGTDAGLGGITTVEWAAEPKGDETAMSRIYWDELVDQGHQFVAADVDGHEGVDTVVFSNGFGDGGFPSIAGYDPAGRRAQIVLWTVVAPWRLAFPHGTPPRQVTTRERALAGCLAGRRTIDGARCRVAR